MFAWKGETLEEYWWCTVEALVWPDGTGPHLIVDDGGDATLLVHKGAEFERAGKVPDFDADQDPEEWGVILDALRREQLREPKRWTRIAAGIRGVSEETTTGVHRLYQMAKDGVLAAATAKAIKTPLCRILHQRPRRRAVVEAFAAAGAFFRLDLVEVAWLQKLRPDRRFRADLAAQPA